MHETKCYDFQVCKYLQSYSFVAYIIYLSTIQERNKIKVILLDVLTLQIGINIYILKKFQINITRNKIVSDSI